MSEQELQAIKEQLANVPEGWSVSEGAHIIKGLKVSGNYLAAEVEFLHVQRDSQVKIIEELRAKNTCSKDEVQWLRSESARLRKQLDHMELAEAKARMENERLRAALEFYADRDNYYQSEDDRMTGYPPEVFGDNGFTARKVLAGESK